MKEATGGVATFTRSSVVNATFGIVPSETQLVPLFVLYWKSAAFALVLNDATMLPESSYPRT